LLAGYRKQIAKEQPDRNDSNAARDPGEQSAPEDRVRSHADENHRDETPDEMRDLQFLFHVLSPLSKSEESSRRLLLQ
jgi:hypothetical protein